MTGDVTSNAATDPECSGDNGTQANSGVGNISLIASPTMVLALQGMSKDELETRHTISSNNNVQVPWSSNLSGLATVTLLHDRPIGSDTSIHDRAECALQYANSAGGSAFTNLGEPQMVSAFGTKEIVSMTLVGSQNLVRGNVVAMAARNG